MAEGDQEKDKKDERSGMTYGEAFDTGWGMDAAQRQFGEEAKKKKKPGASDQTNNKKGNKS